MVEEKCMNKTEKTYYFPYTLLYIRVSPFAFYADGTKRRVSECYLPSSRREGQNCSTPFKLYSMEIYNTRWFAVLWMLIWIVTIALVVAGCRLYYRYKEAKDRMKRKRGEENEQKKSELEEINNPIKQ